MASAGAGGWPGAGLLVGGQLDNLQLLFPRDVSLLFFGHKAVAGPSEKRKVLPGRPTL